MLLGNQRGSLARFEVRTEEAVRACALSGRRRRRARARYRDQLPAADDAAEEEEAAAAAARSGGLEAAAGCHGPAAR